MNNLELYLSTGTILSEKAEIHVESDVWKLAKFLLNMYTYVVIE